MSKPVIIYTQFPLKCIKKAYLCSIFLFFLNNGVSMFTNNWEACKNTDIFDYKKSIFFTAKIIRL